MSSCALLPSEGNSKPRYMYFIRISSFVASKDFTASSMSAALKDSRTLRTMSMIRFYLLQPISSKVNSTILFIATNKQYHRRYDSKYNKLTTIKRYDSIYNYICSKVNAMILFISTNQQCYNLHSKDNDTILFITTNEQLDRWTQAMFQPLLYIFCLEKNVFQRYISYIKLLNIRFLQSIFYFSKFLYLFNICLSH